MTPPVVRLDDPGLAWVEAAIPASSPPVRLVRLQVATSGASVSLVRFPPGWTRPGLGHYACAEEFVVLEGWLEVSGVRTAAGEYAFLPPRAQRAGSRVSASGCLAVAWFSAAPRWTDGAPERPAVGSARGGPVPELRRDADGEVPGRARWSAAVAATAAAFDRDVLAVDARVWAFVPAGAPVPGLAGPVVVREWSR